MMAWVPSKEQPRASSRIFEPSGSRFSGPISTGTGTGTGETRGGGKGEGGIVALVIDHVEEDKIWRIVCACNCFRALQQRGQVPTLYTVQYLSHSQAAESSHFP